MLKVVGLVAAVVLPLWNIPFIYRVIKRKSSEDVSLSWVFGVWVCIIAMTPSALSSADAAWKAFSVVNFILFTGVVITVLKYRKRGGNKR